MNDSKLELVAMLIAVAFLLLGYLAIANWQCGSRWEGSRMQTTWGPIQGCKVHLPDGRWLPEDRVREVDLREEK